MLWEGSFGRFPLVVSVCGDSLQGCGCWREATLFLSGMNGKRVEMSKFAGRYQRSAYVLLSRIK